MSPAIHCTQRFGWESRLATDWRNCADTSPAPLSPKERLSVAKNGHIVYRFRKAWRNGKTAVVLDPMTFLSRLAAQVPPPRFHMLTYHGVLAPAASRRDEIVPGHDAGADAGPTSEMTSR